MVLQHPEWKQLVEETMECEYGTAYSHDEIARMLHLPKESARYFTQVQKWKRAMRRDHRRCVETVHGKGYRIVLPNEHHGVAREWVSRAGRRMRYAAESLVAAPQELLTDAENARNADALAKIGTLRAMQRKVMSETRPSLPAPRPDLPKMLTK